MSTASKHVSICIGLLMTACTALPAEEFATASQQGATVAAVQSPFASRMIDAADYPEFLSAALRADAVVLAELLRVDFSDSRGDGFLTTTEWRVVESARGSWRRGDIIRVRFPLGRKPSGDWEWIADQPAISPNEGAQMKPGDSFALLLSDAVYDGQSRARSGAPLPGFTGAGLGLYRAEGADIGLSGPFRVPSNFESIKRLLENRS